MTSKLKIAAIAIIAILAPIAIVYAATQLNLTVPTSGNITDSELTSSPATIDWGNVAHGASVQRKLNITNTSTEYAHLNLSAATPVGSVTWNAEAYELLPNSSVNVTITLTVFENATDGAFEFPLYIKG